MSYPGYPPSGPPGGGYPSSGYPPPSGSPSNIGFAVPPVSQGQGMPGYSPYPAAGAGYPSAAPYPSNTSQYPSTNVPSPYPSNPAPYGQPAPYPSNVPGSGYPSSNVPGSGYPPSNVPGSGYPPANTSPYNPTSGYPVGGAPPPGGPQMGYQSATSYPGAAPSAYPGYSPYPTNPAGVNQPGASAPYGQAPSAYAGANPAYPGANPGAYPAVAPSSGGYAPSYPPTSLQNYGTIQPYAGFDPRSDSDGLRKAMKGFGTDEKAIVRILANRTYQQRHQIVVTYKTQFGKDLISHLKDELSGNFEDVIVALLIPKNHLLAKHLYKACAGMGTAESTLVEIMCSASNADIHEINAIYKQQYNSSLERDLKDETYGFFKRLLVSLNMGNRDESTHVDQARAIQDAQSLYQAGQGRWGTDESAFNRILVAQSYAQLRAVFQEYERLTSRPIEHALKSEMTGDVLNGMLAIVACVRNKIAFFAERLHHCMSGAGTFDMTLIRIIVTRSEIDLALIKQEFQRMYGKSLSHRIASETSGDYKRVLLEILHD